MYQNKHVNRLEHQQKITDNVNNNQFTKLTYNYTYMYANQSPSVYNHQVKNPTDDKCYGMTTET